MGFSIADKSLSGNVAITNLDNGRSLGLFPFGNGEFYKVLEEGNYQFEVASGGKNWTLRQAVRFPSHENNGNFTTLNSL